MNITELKVPKNLHCPNCNGAITNMGVTRGAPNQSFQKGVVLICSKCATPLQVGDSGLVRMTPEQINALSTQSKDAILKLKLAITRMLQDRQKKPVDLNQSSKTG